MQQVTGGPIHCKIMQHTLSRLIHFFSIPAHSSLTQGCGALLEPIPSFMRQRQGTSMTSRQFITVHNSQHMYVFGLWQEATGGNSHRHVENMQNPHGKAPGPGSNPQPSCWEVDSANYCITITSQQHLYNKKIRIQENAQKRCKWSQRASKP